MLFFLLGCPFAPSSENPRQRHYVG